MPENPKPPRLARRGPISAELARHSAVMASRAAGSPTREAAPYLPSPTKGQYKSEFCTFGMMALALTTASCGVSTTPLTEPICR